MVDHWVSFPGCQVPGFGLEYLAGNRSKSYWTTREWDSTISCLCGVFRNSLDKQKVQSETETEVTNKSRWTWSLWLTNEATKNIDGAMKRHCFKLCKVWLAATSSVVVLCNATSCSYSSNPMATCVHLNFLLLFFSCGVWMETWLLITMGHKQCFAATAVWVAAPEMGHAVDMKRNIQFQCDC